MEKICPICNGLNKIIAPCPKCHLQLLDGGLIDDYLGPYSPYETQQLINIVQEEECIHLLYCPNCGYDQQVGISEVHI